VGLHIIVASPDDDLRLGLHLGLVNAAPGHSVSAVASAPEVFGAAGSNHADVIVVDVRLFVDAVAEILDLRNASAGSQLVVLGEDQAIREFSEIGGVRLVSSSRPPRALVSQIADVVSSRMDREHP
jgi:predicted short-subunit dehydrogenase-like oxidoreductase (DUF2520 family)